MTTEGDLQNMEEKSSLISFPEEVRKGPTWEGGGLGKVREGGKKKEIGGMMIQPFHFFFFVFFLLWSAHVHG